MRRGDYKIAERLSWITYISNLSKHNNMNNPNNIPGDTFKEVFIKYISDRTKDKPETYEIIYWELIDVIMTIEDIITNKTQSNEFR